MHITCDSIVIGKLTYIIQLIKISLILHALHFFVGDIAYYGADDCERGDYNSLIISDLH